MWPDEFDIENGLFYYWGDNKKPGQERDGPVGNKSLKEWFNLASKGKEERKKISPIFVFSSEKGWNRRFQGLLVPGCNKMSEEQNLVSIWKQKNGLRFENYRAIFSILDVKKVRREWIQDIFDGNSFSQNAPTTWMDWITNGTIKNLLLIQQGFYLLKKYPNVKLSHVKAHTGNNDRLSIGNSMADQLSYNSITQ